MAKILIVDDDPAILEMLSDFLLSEGFDIQTALNGEEALNLLEIEKKDLVILDVMMPRVDGWETAAWIKESIDVPILFLTAKGTLADKLKGFDLGAEDYLVKPFLLEELFARIKVILKRRGLDGEEFIRFPDFIFDYTKYQLNVSNQLFDLPPKEAELLRFFLNNKERTLTREQLIIQVWGYDFNKDERTLDVHIKRLREKIQGSVFQIVTVRGIGYRLEEKR